MKERKNRIKKTIKIILCFLPFTYLHSLFFLIHFLLYSLLFHFFLLSSAPQEFLSFRFFLLPYLFSRISSRGAIDDALVETHSASRTMAAPVKVEGPSTANRVDVFIHILSVMLGIVQSTWWTQ